MCQGDMYSLFDLFSNKFCIINSETHNISKRKHLLHFTTKVLLIKVLRWAIFILHNLRFGQVDTCFTYVTKTCANLTTHSRKPENYNGTIVFEIDIMKNLSPINLNLCQT